MPEHENQQCLHHVPQYNPHPKCRPDPSELGTVPLLLSTYQLSSGRGEAGGRDEATHSSSAQGQAGCAGPLPSLQHPLPPIINSIAGRASMDVWVKLHQSGYNMISPFIFMAKTYECLDSPSLFLLPWTKHYFYKVVVVTLTRSWPQRAVKPCSYNPKQENLA